MSIKNTKNQQTIVPIWLCKPKQFGREIAPIGLLGENVVAAFHDEFDLLSNHKYLRIKNGIVFDKKMAPCYGVIHSLFYPYPARKEQFLAKLSKMKLLSCSVHFTFSIARVGKIRGKSENQESHNLPLSAN